MVSVLTVSLGYPSDDHPGRMLFTHEQAKALSRAGARVDAVDLGPHPAPIEAERDGIRVHRVPFPRRFRADPRRVLSELQAARRGLRGLPGRFDLVLLSFLDQRYLPVLGALPRAGCLAITIHGVDAMLPHHPLHARVARRWLAGRADRLFAVSEATAALIRPFLRRPERLCVCPNGVDRDKLDRAVEAGPEAGRAVLGLGSDPRPVVLSVANLVPRKGIDLVMGAIGRLRDRGTDAVLVIVGRGPEHDRLAEQARRLDLMDHVWFVDRALADVDLASTFVACDVFALGSRTQYRPPAFEGFGVVYAEAAYVGRPAVGGRSGGVPEVVVDGETGILVDPDQPSAEAEYAEALERLLLDPALRARMGNAAAARARVKFDWDRQAGCILRAAGLG